MSELNPKALEAAVYEADSKNTMMMTWKEQIAAIIQAYNDEAGLLERRKYDDMVRALMHDNDEARREAEELKGAYQQADDNLCKEIDARVKSQDEADERGKQLAALREAVELIADLPVAHITPLRMRNLRTVFADTAKAAALHQPVDDEHVVVSKKALAPFERWERDHLSGGINWVPDAYLLSGAMAGPPDLTAGDIRRLCVAAPAEAKPEASEGTE